MARNETLRTCHHNGHLRLQTRGELSETGGPILLPVTYASARKIRPRRDAIYLLRKGDSNNVAHDRSRHDITSHRYFSTRRINYIVTRFEEKDSLISVLSTSCQDSNRNFTRNILLGLWWKLKCFYWIYC